MSYNAYQSNLFADIVFAFKIFLKFSFVYVVLFMIVWLKQKARYNLGLEFSVVAATADDK